MPISKGTPARNHNRWICPASWRIGPNPLFTAVAAVAILIELVLLFLRKPIDYLNNEFLAVFVVAAVCFIWISIAWLVWAVLQAINRIRAIRFRWPLYVIFSLLLLLIACAYSLAWFGFLYSGVFPNAQAASFLGSGSQTDFNFILFVVNQTLPHALFYFSGFCALLAVAIPFGLRKGIKSRWDSLTKPSHHAVALFSWLLTGLTALFCLGFIFADSDRERLNYGTERINAQVNPIITMGLENSGQHPDEEISPDINLATLQPIKPGDNALTTTLAIKPTPSVIYMAVESLRADVLFGKHQGREIMPNLNRLARKSILFTNAHSTSTHTDYALLSYLSSMYPLRTQTHHNSVRPSPFPKKLIYEVLKPYGYSAGVITSDSTGWCNMIDFIWSRDLDIFYDAGNLPPTYIDESENRGYVGKNPDEKLPGSGTSDDAETIDYVMKWIDTKIESDKPYFLHTFFQQTHFGYHSPDNAPKPFQPADMNFTSTFDSYPKDKVEIVHNAYLNCAFYVDLQIGKLVDYLEERGQLDNTIIVFSGDHGEGFLEHDLITHSRIPYEEFTHVPMFIYAPMISSGEEIDYPVEQIDMAPTLCAMLGVPIPLGYQGVDVLSDKRPALKDRYVYAHVEVPTGRAESVTYAGRWKYIFDRRANDGQLYDLQNDPGEKHDIQRSNRPMAAKLKNNLFDWRATQLAYYKYNIYYEYYYPPKTTR